MEEITTGAIARLLAWVKSLALEGTETRGQLINSAFGIANAIQMATVATSQRLSAALLEDDLDERRRILTELREHEMVRMGQVNELCESIGSAANQLLHPPSDIWRHVDLRHQELVRNQLELLQDRETGLQRLLHETLSQPHGVSDPELDRWIRMKLQEFGELSSEAADAAATLAKFL